MPTTDERFFSLAAEAEGYLRRIAREADGTPARKRALVYLSEFKVSVRVSTVCASLNSQPCSMVGVLEDLVGLGLAGWTSRTSFASKWRVRILKKGRDWVRENG